MRGCTEAQNNSVLDAFLRALGELPTGYFRARFGNATYGITLERLANGRQVKLYGEELGGSDHVSFNLYLPTSGQILLKPCEMSAAKVMAFVEGLKRK